MPNVYKLEELNSYTIPRPHIAIIPFGSTEQHDNLPLSTDTLIASCITRKIADKLTHKTGIDVIVYPQMPYGHSPEWNGSPGTITVPPDILQAVLTSIAKSASSAGARILIAVNAHGGNTGILNAAAPHAATKAGIPIMVLDIHKTLKECGAGPVGHACDVERALLKLCGHDVPEKPTKTLYGRIVSGIYNPPNSRIYALQPENTAKPDVNTMKCIVEKATGIISELLEGKLRGIP